MPLFAFLLLGGCYFLSGYGILSLFHLVGPFAGPADTSPASPTTASTISTSAPAAPAASASTRTPPAAPRLPTAFVITLSLILGLAVASFLPFLLQLFYITLTGPSIFGSLFGFALLLNIPLFLRIRKDGFPSFRRSLIISPFRIRPYEIPWLSIIAFLIFVSVWRCYYLPPTSRDALSGPEVIAEYAVREHTMINSFFNVDLWSTNNQFKSPYLISLQMIYKMAGFPFGQIWLSILFVSFTIFLYQALKERVHPILAGLLLLLFLMTPEMYAYTFMILYDYSNMVFLFLGLYFLFRYFNNGVKGTFYLAGLLTGIATYIRSETLALVILFLPLIGLVQIRTKSPFKKLLLEDFLFLLPALIGYYLPTQLYIKYYLPIHYDIGGLMNEHLSNLHPLWQRYEDMVNRLMRSEFAIQLWGYLFYITAAVFLLNVIYTLFRRRPFLRGQWNKKAGNWLYAIVVLYLGLGALGYLLPMMNLDETTKRALFKLLPLLIFFMADTELLSGLSTWITRWEQVGLPRPAVAATSVATPSPRATLSRGAKNTTSSLKNTPSSGPSSPRNAPSSGKKKQRRK